MSDLWKTLASAFIATVLLKGTAAAPAFAGGDDKGNHDYKDDKARDKTHDHDKDWDKTHDHDDWKWHSHHGKWHKRGDNGKGHDHDKKGNDKHDKK